MHVNDLGSAPRRTTSGRAVRANTTRPTNYYARAFGSFSAAQATNNTNHAVQDETPAGFFPALQYFTDAVTALPKEVMRQFTLMKEVDAKIHGPSEKLGEMLDTLLEYPVPPKRSPHLDSAAEEQRRSGLAAENRHDVDSEATSEVESEEDLAKRRKFRDLRALLGDMVHNLDEKNNVLAEANRVLSQQMSRVDSVMPHVDSELSEEARLGSMTHWAYSDNRQKKQTTGAGANRRDIAATNILAAAASGVHESDIAAARQDAIRETKRDKHRGRGKEHVDSDFDDKPKKTKPKFGKDKNMGLVGLGISSANGETVKKRKVDKGLAAPAMERMQSSATKGAKGMKETPRSTPASEPAKKSMKARPAPLPAKRKVLNSSHASPALASSPLPSSFNVGMDPPSGRPQSARLRQNSTATNLRHEKLVQDDGIRPTSAPSKVNGERMQNGKRKAHDDGQEYGDGSADYAKKTTEAADGFKHEDVDMADNERGTHPSRSTSNSGKAGQGSNTVTPRTDSFPEGGPAMLRALSTRSQRGNNREGSSSEPGQSQSAGGSFKHKRQRSHLVKQLAPFNRSPDLDRRREEDGDGNVYVEVELLDGEGGRREEDGMEMEMEMVGEERSPRKRRGSSRRNTGLQVMEASSPPAGSDHAIEDIAMADAVEEEPDDPTEFAEAISPPSLDPIADPDPDPAEHIFASESEAAADDSEPGDPDDPNEPKYCYCNRGSYGEMIACDNEQCPREWFHLGCTELAEPPEESEKWYCAACRPLFGLKKGRGRGRGGGVGKG